MRLRSQIRIVSLIIPSLLVVSIVVFGAIAVNSVQAKLYYEILENETEHILNLLESEYSTLKRAGVNELPHYTINSQQQFLLRISSDMIDLKADLIITDSQGEKLASTLKNSTNMETLPQHPTGGVLTAVTLGENEYFCFNNMFKPWDWNVYLVINKSTMLAERNSFIFSVVAIAAVLLVVGMFFSYKISLSLQSSVDSVVGFIRQVEKGDHSSAELAGAEIDELNIIQDGLRQMVSTIDERNARLHEYQEHLEELVKERTNELQLKVESSLREIESREQAEEELEKTRTYLSNVINSMPSVIVGVDPQGVITQWNVAGEQQFGDSNGDAVGKRLEEVIPHMQTELAKIKEAVESRHPQMVSKRLRETETGKCYEDIAIFPLLTQSGVDGAVIRIDDVSDRVYLENLMMQNEKMSSIAGLAAGMAHEINNPLAAITQGYQNILNRINPAKEQNREAARAFNLNLDEMYSYLEDRRIITFLNGGRIAVERAAKIVKNMLMFSRANDSEVILTDIKQLVEKTIELGATDYDMKKKYDFKFIDIVREYEIIPLVKCCAVEIEQVLLNLFKNALQAMEERNDADYRPQFHVRLKNDKSFVRIEIQDNGPGISDDHKSKVFNPFFTTKAAGEGTGLGLSVSYSIITQNHGGTFEVESEMGVGTTFTIRLPI